VTIEPHEPPPAEPADPDVPGSGEWPSIVGLALVVGLVIVVVLVFAEFA
jgi:hypothetical protein